MATRSSCRAAVRIGFLCILIAASMVGGNVSAGASTNASTAAAPVSVIEVPMQLDCVHMTPSARDYATKNRLCPVSGRLQPQIAVSGTCGTSYIFMSPAGGGRVRISYGYRSTVGIVVVHFLRVSWYNYRTFEAGGFDDNRGRFSTDFSNVNIPYVRTGFVTGAMSGFVGLVWGGTCQLLVPSASTVVT